MDGELVTYKLVYKEEPTRESVLEKARGALIRIYSSKTLFDDWLLVGHALALGRYEVMAETGANEPEGRRYNKGMSAWLTKNGLINIDAGDRSRLLYIMDNLDKVMEWRKELRGLELVKYNAPSTVFRHFKAWLKRNEPKPDESDKSEDNDSDGDKPESDSETDAESKDSTKAAKGSQPTKSAEEYAAKLLNLLAEDLGPPNEDTDETINAVIAAMQELVDRRRKGFEEDK